MPLAQESSLAARKPALFEQCLELLYELAASPETGGLLMQLGDFMPRS